MVFVVIMHLSVLVYLFITLYGDHLYGEICHLIVNRTHVRALSWNGSWVRGEIRGLLKTRGTRETFLPVLSMRA